MTPGRDLDELNSTMDVGFSKLVGLRFTSLEPDEVRAEWTLRPELMQPYGITHGGVHCAVVETVASIAGAVWLGERGQVVGVNNSTDFLRASREGTLTAVATPIHRGRLQQLWEVRITDAEDRLLAKGQVRLQNITDPERLGAERATSLAPAHSTGAATTIDPRDQPGGGRGAPA